MMERNFDILISGKEFKKINDHNGYRFCPRCTAALSISPVEDVIRPHCPSCGFVFYQNPAPAAGAIIVEDNRILLVQRSVDPRKGDWCIPAGFTEWTEHPQQTAVRELKEETGLDIRLTDLFEMFMGMDDPRTHALLILYLGEIVGGELTAGDDAAEARFFGFDDLPENIAFEAHESALMLYQRRFLNDESANPKSTSGGGE